MMGRYDNVKKIGFWYSGYEPTLPKPHVDKEYWDKNPDRKKQVVAYLDNHKECNWQKGWLLLPDL